MSEPSAHPDPAEVLAIRETAALLRIAHHIPGRVRLKVGADAGLAQAVDKARGFLQSVTAIAGIRSVNVNLLARSCLVEYDPEVIPPSAWQDLIGGTRSAAADALVGALAAACR